jgi:hypothetical protein
MRPAKKRTSASNAREESDLLELELRIAKRADALWKRGGCGRGKDLVLWLQAERDVLRTFRRVGRPAATPPPASKVGIREAWLVG